MTLGRERQKDYAYFEKQQREHPARFTNALGVLAPRERQVIAWRLPSHLGVIPSMTLEDIGERLGVSTSRIREIETMAIVRLKQRLWQLQKEEGGTVNVETATRNDLHVAMEEVRRLFDENARLRALLERLDNELGLPIGHPLSQEIAHLLKTPERGT